MIGDLFVMAICYGIGYYMGAKKNELTKSDQDNIQQALHQDPKPSK